MDIYNEIIMTYAKESPNKFIMKNFTIKHKEQSRVCGDDIEVFLEIKKNKIENFSFIWNTSIITTACASIFWESIIWKKVTEILNLNSSYIKNLVWKISPRRKYWANLWLLATRNALHSFLKDWQKDDFIDILVN